MRKPMKMPKYLQQLESESINIIRETVKSFQSPYMLYSVGKDSSVMVRLAQKAFYPAPVSFPLIHIDTGFKFPEMYEFRDSFCRENNLNLKIFRNEDKIKDKANPKTLGMDKCCSFLKTGALLQALKEYQVDAAFGGARRDEEKSRAKERVFSFRDKFGQWNPKNQRPEVWNLYNSHIDVGESVRVFPLSNWTEFDVWNYIKYENIPIVPLYYAKKRKVLKVGDKLIPIHQYNHSLDSFKNVEEAEVMCRYRSLGCIPCSGAVESNAVTIDQIIQELEETRVSERNTRLIDFTSQSSMEEKKKQGYF